MNVLFLDDSQARITRFRHMVPFAIIVETASDCIEKIKSEKWDWIFLDHDLGGEMFVDSDRVDTGMEVVRHLVEHELDYSVSIIVHSCNAPAREQMCLALSLAGYDVRPVPFPYLEDNIDLKEDANP